MWSSPAISKVEEIYPEAETVIETIVVHRGQTPAAIQNGSNEGALCCSVGLLYELSARAP